MAEPQQPGGPGGKGDRTLSLAAGTPAVTGIGSVDDLQASLSALDLLDAPTLAEVSKLAARTSDPRQLARDLVQRGCLTPLQVNYLFQGKGRDLVLGPYVLLEKLGEGGMGAVYKARHRLMHRTVALKLIRKDRLGNPDAVQRFYREVRAAAQVQHPNVVLAHDANSAGDVHFLAMEYVEGADLARVVKQQGPLPVGLACDYVRQAALGLQHAHEKGLIHRDVKPHNLLLAACGLAIGGAKPQAAVVKVLDLGLARLSGVGEQLTQDGSVMGTPDYMAPEQAVESHTVDARADVYSLGCTLYFLLTGSVPYPGGTLMQKLTKHRDDPIPSARALRADIPIDLDAIVARMMAKKPGDRFQTAGDVARAIEPFATRSAIPVAVGAAEETGAYHAASIPSISDAAGETLPEAGLPSPRSPIKRRNGLIAAGVGATILLLVILYWPGSKSNDTPAPDDRSPDRVKLPPRVTAVLGQRRVSVPGQPIVALAISADGRRLAVGNGTTIRLADAETLLETGSLPSFPELCELVFSPDGKTLAAAGSRDVVLYDVSTRERLPPLAGHKGSVRSVVFMPDGKRLASGSLDATVRLWDLDSGKELAQFGKHNGPIFSVAVSAQGQVLSGGGRIDRGRPVGCEAWEWEPDRDRSTNVVAGQKQPILAVAWSPDGKRRLLFDAGGGMTMLGPDGKASGSLTVTKGDSAIRVAPGGKHHLVHPGPKQQAWLVETASNLRVHTLKLAGTAPPVFLADGCRVLVPHGDGLQLWDAIDNQPLPPATGSRVGVTQVRVVEAGRVLYSVSRQRLSVWDVQKKTERVIEEVRGDAILLSPSASHALGVKRTDGKVTAVELWQLSPLRMERRRQTSVNRDPMILLDDRTVFGFYSEGALHGFVGWDLVENRNAWGIGTPDLPADLKVEPILNGKLAVGSNRQTKVVLRFDLHRVQHSRVAANWERFTVAADLKIVYYGTASGDVAATSLQDLKATPFVFPQKHHAAITLLALTPDGSRLITADALGHFVLWDSARREDNCLDEWDSPDGPADCISFTDGGLAALGNRNGTIHLIRLGPLE